MTQDSFKRRTAETATAIECLRSKRIVIVISLLTALLSAGFASGCATRFKTNTLVAGTREVSELAPGIPTGYLSKDTRPNSMTLLDPPPFPGSAAMTLDDEIRAKAVSLRGSARWKQAARDADLRSGNAVKEFECALGTTTGPHQTPRLYQMMRRVMVDSGYSSAAAKNEYSRARPFVVNDDVICTPKDDGDLRRNGSYPSGHSAIGWAWALVLVQLAPDRTNELLARGRSFGESRVVCNVHWMSDVVAGRIIGAATVARLQSVPEFAEDIAIARGELARSGATGSSTPNGCEEQAAALAATSKQPF